MPLSLATCRDQSILEHISLFIGAMAACSLILKSFPDTIIRMVVAFVAGEPSRDDDVFPLWKHPRKLVPLSRRFVPEPVEMTYIVTDVWFGSVLMGQAAALPNAISEFIRSTPMINAYRTDPYVDERICSICAYRAGEIVCWVQQVTLQTRLRRPVWPNTAAFRAFVNAHKEHVEINACRSCKIRCGMLIPAYGMEHVRRRPARPS